MRSIEERLQAVEDREAIRELTARYCHAITAADVAGIVGSSAKTDPFPSTVRSRKVPLR